MLFKFAEIQEILGITAALISLYMIIKCYTLAEKCNSTCSCELSTAEMHSTTLTRQ